MNTDTSGCLFGYLFLFATVKNVRSLFVVYFICAVLNIEFLFRNLIIGIKRRVIHHQRSRQM